MTKKTMEAARDSISKIKDLTPKEAQIREMLSFLSVLDRLSEICNQEGPAGLRLEAGNLPRNHGYEKAFREGVFMWLNGSEVDDASDHVADRYFEDNPAGYDAAVYFAAVFGIGNILKGAFSYGFIDQGLQCLLPDGWRWFEEDEKEMEAHKDDKDWFPLTHNHRRDFIGEHGEEIRHRFDDVITGNLITMKDPSTDATGQRIADRLPDYQDGALQLILKELTYQDLAKALYALPEEAEKRIVSNLSSHCIPIIKGYCILNKDSISLIDIRIALLRFEKAINAYDGDPALETEYE